MTFAQRLAELLKNGNMTAYRLSKTLGVHQTTVKNWLDGNSKPRTEYMEKIAEHFGVSIDYLMGNSNDPHKGLATYNGTCIVDEQKKEDGATERQIKQLNKLISHDPIKTWNFLSILCRNERIEKDLTERYVAQSSNVPLQEYLNFEVNGAALPQESMISILNALSLDPPKVFDFLKGYMAASIKDNSDKEKFLSDHETEHEKLLNEVMLQILQLGPDELEKLLDNFQTQLNISDDHIFDKKLEKAIRELNANKKSPQNEPGA